MNNFVFLTLLFTVSLPSVSSIFCHLCESVEGETDCYASSCVGVACIKRSGEVDGKIRVQKMCQVSGDPLPASTASTCRESFLWQGNLGTECICRGDWCNGATTAITSMASSTLSLYILASIMVRQLCTQ